MPQVWAGVDVGKEHHHCVVIDTDGTRLLSRRVRNDEADLRALISDVAALGSPVTWAVDLVDGPAMLLITLLAEHAARVLYLPGRLVHRAAETYRGEGKTDARDAAVIADQDRMRRDLQPVRVADELVAQLRMVTRRREDLVADRVRTVNRLRGLLLEYFPALERAFTWARSPNALVLLRGFRTPAEIRSVTRSQLVSWLKVHNVRNADAIAGRAVSAAEQQSVTVPGEQVAADLVRHLVRMLTALDEEIRDLDSRLKRLLAQHDQAVLLASMPGVGPQLAAELLVSSGGDVLTFGSPDRLASVAGLAPVPQDSGKVSGNLHRPRRYSRRLQRAFYLSAMAALIHCPTSKAFYQRKRAEGKRHAQALLALARRRVNVMWALVRDGEPFATQPVSRRAIA
jgi:transposase